MSEKLAHDIQEIMEGGGIPQRVSNSLLCALAVEGNRNIEKLIKRANKQQAETDALKAAIEVSNKKWVALIAGISMFVSALVSALGLGVAALLGK